MMVAFGYVAGNSKSFNFWKLALLVLFVIPFISEFNFSKAHLLTMLGAFLIGYWLPFAYMLEGLGEAISDLINALRYRDAYEEIRRKEEEVEELRRKYEQAQKESNRAKQEQEYKRRQQESQNYRRSQSQQKSQQQDSSRRNHRSHSSGRESIKSKYLRILELDPSGNYDYKDIKKAYRRQAAKYHPDKHQTKGSQTVKEMGEKFKEVKEAYEWLALESR